MKRIICLVLTLIIMTSPLSLGIYAEESDIPKAEDIFTDLIPDAWYIPSVQYVYENGLMSGMSISEFKPNVNVTRAQMVQMLFNLSGESAEDYRGYSDFEDVSPMLWCAPAVNWAKKQEITAGVTETTFDPHRDISRQEMIRMFYVYAEKLGYDMRELDKLSAFEDSGDIAPWAYTEIQWAVAKKLISGMTETTILPRATANRAQAARLLMQFCEFLKNTEPMNRSGAFELVKLAIIENGEKHKYFDEYSWDFEDEYGHFSYSAIYNEEEQSIRFTFSKFHTIGLPTNFEWASIKVDYLDDTYTYSYIFDNDCIIAEGTVGNGTYTEDSFEFNETSYMVENEEDAREMEKNTREGLIKLMDKVLNEVGLERDDLFITK